MGLHDVVAEVLRAAAAGEEPKPCRYDPPPCPGCEAMVQEGDPVYFCECGEFFHWSCGEAHAAGRQGHGDAQACEHASAG
jgi:hypothetical protein